MTTTTTTNSNSGMTSRNLAIEGMSGEECVKKVTAAIKGVPSVRSPHVSVGSATITADAAGCASACEAIGRAGYPSHESNKDGQPHGTANANSNPSSSANTHASATSNAGTRPNANTPANRNAGDAAMRSGNPASNHAPVKSDPSVYSGASRSADDQPAAPAADVKPNATTANDENAKVGTGQSGTSEPHLKPHVAKS